MPLSLGKSHIALALVAVKYFNSCWEFLHRELNIGMHPTPDLPTAGGIIGPNISPQTWR
jgi:hypothetical protein